jgi:hypothetical protein
MEKRNAYRVVVRKGKEIISLGRPRRRWEDNKIDLEKIGGREGGCGLDYFSSE